jgi:hypothetical protein
LYFADGVSNFTVQLAYYDANGIPDWIPENADFPAWDLNPPLGVFIFFFNLYDSGSVSISDFYDRSGNWPPALKFTFTLYDSKRVFRNGQTFTHIVYLGD